MMGGSALAQKTLAVFVMAATWIFVLLLAVAALSWCLGDYLLDTLGIIDVDEPEGADDAPRG